MASQNSIPNFFENKIEFMIEFPENRISIDVSITNVGLILTKHSDFFSRGTDRQDFVIFIWKYVCTQKNFDSKLKINS